MNRLEPAVRIPEVPGNWIKWATWIGLACAFLAFLSPMRVADPDMWHQMALFREAAARGSVPQEDVFAYTPTVSPVIHHEWGHGAVLYLVTVAAGTGSAGLMVLKYLLAAAIAAGCIGCAMRRGADWQVVAWLSVLAIGLGRIGFTTVRAQVFTLLLLVVLLLLLEEDRRVRRWWIALWLPVYVLWLNLHAGFVVGFGLFGLYIVEQILRKLRDGTTVGQLPRRLGHLIATLLAMAGLMMVNPYGFEYVSYLLRAISLQRPLVPEWRPLWEQSQHPEILVIYGISLAGLIYAVACRKMRELPGLLAVAATAYLAARHFRHLSIYAVVWICCVPGYLSGTRLERAIREVGARRGRFLFCFWSLIAVLGLGWAIANQFWLLQLPTDETEVGPGVPTYPGGAVAYLKENGLRGNLMVPFAAGGFVSWKLHPEVKVGIDSRYEAAYPPGAVEENVLFYSGGEGWQSILEKYPTDVVLVPDWSPLDRLLEEADLPWYRVYRDDGYSLFARSEIAQRLPIADRTGRPVPASFP